MMTLNNIGWIHIVRSRDHADMLFEEIFKNGTTIAIYHYAILNEPLLTKDGSLFGAENEKTFVIMTNSFGRDIIDEFINEGLTSYEETVCLDDLLEDEFIETEEEGFIIWSATYIPSHEFFAKLT